METEEATIPAFSMWKMLNDTIPTLLSMEYSESNFRKLENIILSKDFLSVFVFNRDNNLSAEENKMIIEKYKVFTIWLLGRFFHLLSCEKTKTHNLLIEVQVRILQHLSVTEKNIFRDIGVIYVKCLHKLNKYHEDNRFPQSDMHELILDFFSIKDHNNLKDKLNLNSFPVIISNLNICTMLQRNIFKIVGFYILERAKFSIFNGVFYEGLDSLLYISINAKLNFKLEVFNVLIELIEYYNEDMPIEFKKRINCFVACLEQTVCKVYSQQPLECGQDKLLDNLLIQFYRKSNCIVNNFNKSKMTEFLIYKMVEGNSKSFSEILQTQTVLCYVHISNTSNIIHDCINSIFTQQNFFLFPIVQKYFIDLSKSYLATTNQKQIVNVMDFQDSNYDKLKNFVFSLDCSVNCQFKCKLGFIEKVADMVQEIKFQLLTCVMQEVTLSFFDEYDFLSNFFKVFEFHVKNCEEYIDKSLVLRTLIKIPVLYATSNIDIIFHAATHPYLKSLNKTYILKRNTSGSSQEKPFKVPLDTISQLNIGKNDTVPYAWLFLKQIAHTAIQCIHASQKNKDHNCIINKKMEEFYYLLCISAIRSEDKRLILLVAEHIDYMLLLFSNREKVYKDILLLLLDNTDEEIIIAILKKCVNITGLFYKHTVNFLYDENELILKIHSKDSNWSKSYIFEKEIKNSNKKCILENQEIKINKEHGSLFCEKINRILSLKHKSVRLLIVQNFSSLIGFHEIIPHFLRHFEELSNDSDKLVRKAFSKELYFILKNMMHNNIDVSEEFMECLFKKLKIVTKKSLQMSDCDLQETVLQTLESAAVLQQREAVLHITLILLFFIMVPTSKYQLIAVNILVDVAERHCTSTNILYACYKREICEKIAELSALNYELAGWNLATSLEKVSLAFGFFGSKDFVVQECRYLISYFIPLIIKMPKIKTLLNEMAIMNDIDLAALLASKFGNIFLNVFLNESEVIFEQCILFIEKTTGTSSSLLRKRNFQVILNELLLDFATKTNHVIAALKLLATEDSNNQSVNTNDLPDYLQPKLLGVLAYFDIKLISRYSAKEKVLLSLAKLLEFMGPQHVTPVRFKIIAMLRTALNLNYGKFPELNCHVWETFIRSCELDSLAPQIALIFISLLPLHAHFPQKVENIFKFLILDNEKHVRDYIPDLFFVLESNLNEEICHVIRTYLQKLESNSFKEHLKWILKYLNHESSDIKVHALKYLKRLLEKNREELDRMTLGYNGIDSTIVELLDVLVLGCREKNDTLKMHCGICIGELGAIEPSHLPQRYAQKSQSFTFYITEDSFIFDALNELIRALQAEKNTQNMDRFALAIQEILKLFGISFDATSPRHHIWNQFSESQREVMLPLLSSRYAMAQSFEVPHVSPIYGSNLGTSFTSWIYNWICKLISAVNTDKKSLLQVCLPSLKQDNRTLMLFIPYIFLHALLEGGTEMQQEIYNEFMVLLNSYNNKRNLDQEILDVKPLQTLFMASKLKTFTSEEEIQSQCIKVVFVLFDFLDRWLREWEWSKGLSDKHENCVCLKTFLSRFCRLQIARCNYECSEYARALLYLEEYILEDPNHLSNQLGFLTEIYAQLDEPDGVAGVMALQHSEPSTEQRILALEVSGKLADAAACYERIQPTLKPHHLQGLVQCYLNLDNVNTALNFIEGALIQQPECSNILMEMQAEPLWRLGRYSDLDKLLQKSELKNNNSWSVQIGRALLSLKKENKSEFNTVLNELRMQQIEYLGAASLEEGAYKHGYNYIAGLHILNEMQQLENIITDLLVRSSDANACKSVLQQLSVEWELRIKIVQESLKIREPILCLRRVALEQARLLLLNRVPSAIPFINTLLGELWLLSARTARAAGIHQQAFTYTLKAEQYSPPRLFIEKAKLHWIREEHELALTTLRRGVDELGFSTNSSGSSYSSSDGKDNLTIEQRKLCAEAKLLIASYNDIISNVDIDLNKQYYKEAVDVYKDWEKSLVYMAQYYDKLFQALPDDAKDSSGSDLQLSIINYFGKSLQYGNEYIYQSLPRLLSIWFDYGTRFLTVEDNVKEERRMVLWRMTKLVDTFLERLPAYIFFTAFSQIVSRICHPQREVYVELKTIIVKLLLHYPQQSLWMIIPVIKSSYAVRSKRCSEILSDGQLKTPNMIKLINDFTKLAEKLIELCNKEIPDGVQVTTVSSLLRTLPRLISKDDFSEIMVPIQKFKKLVLPNPDFKSSQHNPFPNHYVHIAGIEDELTVITSLQKPRKITLRGSDGKRYVQMLKPKDDLRKDFRLMEFNDIVNQLLTRDAECRQRRLSIRLYSVTPLNEECGLIEWIHDLVGLRPIIMKIYKQKGIGMKTKDLKQACCNQRDPFVKKKEVFTKILLPNHPPVLGEWFRKNFPDAQSWLTARTAYIRTTAVISMVGYILGLGDRHGENILLDSTCGDTVHVDFNCLFNKGETFEWPERVPFRLTQNMVSAMGPLGVEGIFRKSCACSLKVLRTNINTLMSIVTPFVYDPLVSWPKSVPAIANAQNSERINVQAVEQIKNMELRLQGYVRTKARKSLMSLSVEGQANNLIQEAMSIDNLCTMYIGWGPYL